MRRTFSRLPQWLIIYGVVVELIYIRYEYELLPPNLHPDTQGLFVGILLVLATLPSSLGITFLQFLQFGVAYLLGYRGDYTHVFWLRFVTFQVVIALNIYLFSNWSQSRSGRGSQGNR
jgi:hypothetical protein